MDRHQQSSQALRRAALLAVCSSRRRVDLDQHIRCDGAAFTAQAASLRLGALHDTAAQRVADRLEPVLCAATRSHTVSGRGAAR